jgi:hypothetical protein
MAGAGERPRNRYEQAAEQVRQGQRDEARAFLADRPLGPFVFQQLGWGCLGALLGLFLGSWTLVVVNFVVFAGTGLLARAFIRWCYLRDDSGSGAGPETGA